MTIQTEIDRLNANPALTVVSVTQVISIEGDPSNTLITATFDPADRWNGWIANPKVTREEAEKIVAFTSKAKDDPESQYLVFEGDTLVLYSPNEEAGECAGHESTSGSIGNTVYCDGKCSPSHTWEDRVQPDAEGLYSVGFGWVWFEVEEKEEESTDRIALVFTIDVTRLTVEQRNAVEAAVSAQLDDGTEDYPAVVYASTVLDHDTERDIFSALQVGLGL